MRARVREGGRPTRKGRKAWGGSWLGEGTRSAPGPYHGRPGAVREFYRAAGGREAIRLQHYPCLCSMPSRTDADLLQERREVSPPRCGAARDAEPHPLQHLGQVARAAREVLDLVAEERLELGAVRLVAEAAREEGEVAAQLPRHAGEDRGVALLQEREDHLARVPVRLEEPDRDARIELVAQEERQGSAHERRVAEARERVDEVAQDPGRSSLRVLPSSAWRRSQSRASPRAAAISRTVPTMGGAPRRRRRPSQRAA